MYSERRVSSAFHNITKFESLNVKTSKSNEVKINLQGR